MKEIAQQLRETTALLKPLLLKIAEKAASEKPNPKKWSKKEILGHLIDSAANNQQKFVRMLLATESQIDFVGYAQDDWVAIQGYQTASWRQLVRTWFEYNQHIAHIIEHADPEKLHRTVRINGEGEAWRLDFIMSDYVEHLKHHIRAILPDADIESNFGNVYNA
ncbi:MAG: hypothetical protein RL757_682 [Bacteroidota bacterium]|jgi:hypothetical protein